ncbi:Phospholipase D-like domain-containing protein [Candidatus Electrothrix laxa]
MNILTEDNINHALTDCNPSKIAVAYIGTDWEKFLPNENKLTAIIVSPTIGSNPRAIQDVVQKIGWENVYFLKELHAKIYIGDRSAVVGSANLTKNGLSGNRLFELCVETDDVKLLEKLNSTFNTLQKKARQQYPTTESKKNCLKALEKLWGAGISNRIFSNDSEPIQNFSTFELLGKDHFYVCWYQLGDLEYSEEVKDIEPLAEEILMFAETDEVKANKWVFTWRITNESVPHKTAKPNWLYIHQIFPQGVIEKDSAYTKCAIQRSDLATPKPPFEINKKVIEAFKNAIQDKAIAKYLIQAPNEFSLAESMKGVEPLIKKMKDCYAA